MFNSGGGRRVARWVLITAIGVLLGVLTGLLINWQLAPMTTLMYFCVGWAAERSQKHRRETDAYREEWLNKRKSEGAEPEA